MDIGDLLRKTVFTVRLLKDSDASLRRTLDVLQRSTRIALLLLSFTPCLSLAATISPFSSDGCSLFPNGSLKDRNLWCRCCYEHDLAYWRGGTAEEKKAADLALKSCIVETSGDPRLAETVYLGVKIGGQPYLPTWYRWGYGWGYSRGFKALTSEEREAAAQALERRDKDDLASVCGEETKNPATTTNLSDEDHITFFTTIATPLQEAGWRVPIHGWVYEPEHSVVRKGVVAALLKQHYGLTTTPETHSNFDQRVNLFFADNESGVRVVVRLGKRDYPVAPSERNGHFHAELLLDEDIVAKATRDGVLRYSLVTNGKGRGIVEGIVLIPDRKGIAVISDIDDTVKETEVLDHKHLLENTFYRDFRAVPGMAALYRHWADEGATIQFVSSSPWQLYGPLNDFMRRAEFPLAAFSLKYVSFTDETFLNLFKSGSQTKPEQIEPILQALPNHKFILVGDSGEEDPEAYASIAHKHPDQIARIYIRKIEGSRNRDYKTLFSDIPASRWRLFTDPAELRNGIDNLVSDWN